MKKTNHQFLLPVPTAVAHYPLPVTQVRVLVAALSVVAATHPLTTPSHEADRKKGLVAVEEAKGVVRFRRANNHHREVAAGDLFHVAVQPLPTRKEVGLRKGEGVGPLPQQEAGEVDMVIARILLAAIGHRPTTKMRRNPMKRRSIR
jgi:hypothetical protein